MPNDLPGELSNNGENRLFPVFLKLENLQLLIVGAGKVGLEKLTAVLNNAPLTHVKVVARNISTAVNQLAKDYPNVQLIQKDFTEEDLDEKQLVIVAIDEKETSRQIKSAATARNLLVNVADTPDLCDFYLGAIVQKGDVKIAISTNGKSPTFAKRLKEVLSEVLPADVHQLVNNLNAIRNQIKDNFGEKVRQLNQLTANLLLSNKNRTPGI